MNPILKNFYREIHKDLGREHKQFISDNDGLCHSLVLWSDIVGIPTSILAREQMELFKKAGLCIVFPFNEGDTQNYNDEAEFGLIWTNEKRLAWVKEYAEK